MPERSTPSPRPGSSIERYIHSIGRYYIVASIIMTLLIGATYFTVKIALDRHALQQEISFLTSRKFIQFQQLANQTRAIMLASADSSLPEHIIQPMLDDVRHAIADIRTTMRQLEANQERLSRNLLERVNPRDSAGEDLYRELNRQLEDFLFRAERVIDASRKERQRRYSFWGPIDFAVSADSLLMSHFNDLIQHTHNRSGASIGNAVSISTALLLMLAAIFLLASLFLFYPLLKKLRNEHHRKMDFENKLTHLAQTDALTALKNRSFFNSALHTLFRRFERDGAGFSMLLIDLDHFKAINDSFGHPAGDATLHHVARTFQNVFCADDIIARIGGDEFAVLLPRVDDETHLSTMADRVIRAIAAEFPFEGNTLRISASVGGATVPTHATDESSLVRVADLALYAAKSERGNAVIFDEATLATQLEQNEMAAALACAAERNEFIVHYQPKVDLRTGDHLGFEALVRWKHPELGLLAPGAFLPLMEDPRLIGGMTRAVARGVCRDLRAWKEAGLSPGPVAINLPEALLINENGFDILASAIREHDLDWRDLTIEVTEDVFLNRYAERILAAMTRFRKQGVAIALDDFGTGFASLLHLRDFPFDELKIDRGFVADIGLDNRSEQIILAMVDLSRNLGKRCVVEGIETEAQREFLLESGCDIGQGYLFAKPMPGREVKERWFKQSSTGRRLRGTKTPDTAMPMVDANASTLGTR